MKKYAYNEITLMQYIFLINGTQVGTGVLALPRVLAEKAGKEYQPAGPKICGRYRW